MKINKLLFFAPKPRGTGNRELFVLTNTKIDINKDSDKSIYQIDLPKLILRGAEVKHNMKFFTDYIPGNKDEFLERNIQAITEINTNGLLRLNSEPVVLSKISKYYSEYIQDTMRFIAHAGGSIDGHRYTNSLEALNENYQKGFRLFELDIIETKDNYLVASHDWETWKKLSSYEYDVPVDLATFNSYKILGKYTPMDMKAINAWFKKHKDAILVTDKINEPKRFAAQFIDKNRLIMELFDMEAVHEGLKADNLSAMPSQRVIEHMTNSEIKKLKDIRIINAAVSRNLLNTNHRILSSLKENDINVFLYHINSIPGIDEDYVARYELDYVYGMYADKWIDENTNATTKNK